MIIAITDPGKSRAASGLADTLASLRSSHGRKVLLIDADTRRLSRFCAEGQQYRQYQDVVIDTEGYDTLASRAALTRPRWSWCPSAWSRPTWRASTSWSPA
jgi:hypothetical protein